MRAADLRESACFSGLFATLSFFRFDRDSTLRPQTANCGLQQHVLHVQTIRNC